MVVGTVSLSVGAGGRRKEGRQLAEVEVDNVSGETSCNLKLGFGR